MGVGGEIHPFFAFFRIPQPPKNAHLPAVLLLWWVKIAYIFFEEHKKNGVVNASLEREGRA